MPVMIFITAQNNQARERALWMPSPGQRDDPSDSSVWMELLSNKNVIYSCGPQTRRTKPSAYVRYTARFALPRLSSHHQRHPAVSILAFVKLRLRAGQDFLEKGSSAAQGPLAGRAST